MINQEAAIIKSKQFLAKIKGLEIELSGRPLIDWLNFEPISINEVDGNYIIKCSINENLFTSEQVVFEIHIIYDDMYQLIFQNSNDFFKLFLIQLISGNVEFNY